ncbi:MAG: hypothetical protein E6G05_13790 [Actinobacteria bacterium]|jgi:hypothetical protein|nr:MAG: hypothetical protein E6G05_13790 [Actinomycetota bacterium]
MASQLAWRGDGSPRMEVAHVQRRARDLTAVGTQLGAVYELRYRLESDRLALDLVGGTSIELTLGGADFFDLGFSPLFNSLPVIRDGLLRAGPARVYTMRWVDVPSLKVTSSEQRYEPLGRGQVRFTAGDFTADIRFDELGYVLDYPGIATRV